MISLFDKFKCTCFVPKLKFQSARSMYWLIKFPLRSTFSISVQLLFQIFGRPFISMLLLAKLTFLTLKIGPSRTSISIPPNSLLERSRISRKGVAEKRKEIQKNPYHATLLTSIVVFMQEPEGPSPAERKEPTTPTDPNCGFTPNLARYCLILYYFQQLYYFSCKIFLYFKVYSYV